MRSSGRIVVVFACTWVLTVYTIMKSKRLSDLLDALSDERLPLIGKLRSLFAVWGRRSE